MQHNKPLLVKDLGNQIHSIDTLYLDREEFAACYLVASKNEIAVVETNTNYAVPLLLQALEEKGWHKDQVKYIIVTHIHLDHAGGAGKLMEELPRATLVVHPSGKKHLVNPQKLVASAKLVYGEEKFNALYGEIVPIPEERVLASEEEMVLDLGSRKFYLFNTPGHAFHHHAIFDNQSGSLFSGDAFGIGYPRFCQVDDRLVFPSTSPTQFDPELTLSSIERIVAFEPAQVLLTHFGVLKNVGGASRQLTGWLDYAVEVAEQRYMAGYRGEELVKCLETDLWKHYEKLSHSFFKRDLSEDERAFLLLDADINAQGLAHYINKKQS